MMIYLNSPFQERVDRRGFIERFQKFHAHWPERQKKTANSLQRIIEDRPRGAKAEQFILAQFLGHVARGHPIVMKSQINDHEASINSFSTRSPRRSFGPRRTRLLPPVRRSRRTHL